MEPVKIIIIGGGFGGIYALKRLHKIFHKSGRVKITIISEKNYFLFTPLLHEVATGGVNSENIVESIRKILGCCLYEFYLGKAEKINLKNRAVYTAEGVLNYDYLILSPGADTNFYGIPGAYEHSFTLKSLEDAARLKNHCIAAAEKATRVLDENTRKNILRFVIVGGGPTGVELAAELQEFLKQMFSWYYPKEIAKDSSVVLIEKSKELLSRFSKNLRSKSLEVLKKKGIEVFFETSVSGVKKDGIEFSAGSFFETETVIWLAGVRPADIVFEDFNSNAAIYEDNGRFKVNKYLQLENETRVFAVGDASGAKSEDGTFIPALAQAAVQEASVTAENIKLLIEGKNLKPFKYRSAGTLVSLGKWMAAGEIFGFTFYGRFVWWIWRTVYLSKIISFRKKIKVAFDWTLNIFFPRDISQL